MTVPVPVTVLCGLDRDGVDDVATGVLLQTPRVAAVWADPATAPRGYVLCRTADGDGRYEQHRVELRHQCVSCTLREAIVTAVRRLVATGRYDHVLVHLHPGVEPGAATPALDDELAGIAAVDTVVAVLHAGWLDDLSGSDEVQERGIAVTPDDDRSAAVVLASVLDTASVMVLTRSVAAGLDLDEHAALSVLCPNVVRLHVDTGLDVAPHALLSTASYDGDPLRCGLRDPHVRLPNVSGDVQLVRWDVESRAVHPQRLRDALDHLADGVIRSAGHLWVASHPDLVVHWDSAGDCLLLGPQGPWPDDARGSRLALLGRDLDAEAIRDVLNGCLLTDAEQSLGPDGWARFADAFPQWREDPGERGAA